VRVNETSTSKHGERTGNIIDFYNDRFASDAWLNQHIGAIDRVTQKYQAAGSPSVPGFGGGGGTTFPGGGNGGLPSTDVEGGGGPTLPQFGDIEGDQLSQLISDRLGGLIEDPTVGISDAAPLPETELGAAGSQGLRNLIDNGGFDPNLLSDVRKSLRENLEGERQASFETIQDELATRGIARGGTAQEALTRTNERLTANMMTEMRNVATELGLSAADRQLAASNAAATLGEAQRTNNMGFMNERDVQRVTASLAAIDTATSRALGIGDLELRNLATNMAFQEMIFNQRMSLAQFNEAAQQARSGNVTQLVQLLLQLGNQLSAGFVE